MKTAPWILGLGLALGGCFIQPDDDDEGAATEASSSGTSVGPTTDDSLDGSGSGTGSGSVGDADGSESGSGSGSGGEVDATERCDAFCERWLATECDEEWTMAGCLLTCESLTSAAACNDSANTYLDCVEDTTIECDASGSRYAVGCGLQWLDAIGCAVTENPNPEIVEPCEEYCGNVQAAECPNNGPEEDCNVACLWSGNTGVGCDGEWGAYLECANAAEWSCLVGFAIAEGCGEAFTDYGTCVGQAGG